MSDKDQKIFKFISNYIKHPTLEVQLTLVDGEIITLQGKSFLKENDVVTTCKNKVRHIPIASINQADVYSF